MAFIPKSIHYRRVFMTMLFITMTLSAMYISVLSMRNGYTLSQMILPKRVTNETMTQTVTTKMPQPVTSDIMQTVATKSYQIKSTQTTDRPKRQRTELERSIVKYFHLSKSDHRDPLLNRHQFRYRINSAKCTQDVHVLAFVHSAPLNIQERNDIRSTWGGNKVFQGKVFRTVFMLANTQDREVQNTIEQEALNYTDIVQGNFLDTYKNLTYKHIMGILWTTKNCPNVSYILKTDDDTIVNVFNMVNFLIIRKPKTNFLYCSVFWHSPVFRGGKWRISEVEYPFGRYPSYCEGFAYLMTPDVAVKLLNASKETKFVWVDDAYVTGILRVIASVPCSPMVANASYFTMTQSHTGPSVKNVMFILSRVRGRPQLWNSSWNSILKYIK